MSFSDLRDIIIRVLMSWQVLAALAVFILYGFLVSYVADIHRRKKVKVKVRKVKGAKGAKGAANASAEEEAPEENKEA
jgi:hypothetical protein